ncbi:MAG: hypothetical protein GC165_06245 [Armatimonadetes bacterium]|nr:hypothetical protein [Armatimonadota bacterium]
MEHQEVTGKKRWTKVVMVFVIVVTILATIVAVGLNRTDLPEAARSLDKNREAAVKQGLFMSNDDVQKYLTVDDADNGASLLQPLLELPKKYKWDDYEKLTPAMVTAHQAEFDAALAKIELASTKKRVVYTRNWTNPIDTLFPEYASLKAWTKLLCKMTEFARADNQPEKAKRYLHAAAFVATTADDEGVLIAMLVRIACQSIVERELREDVQERGADPRWRDAIESTLKVLDQPYDWHTAMAMEHWFAVSSVDLVIKSPEAFYDGMGGGSAPSELKYGRFLPMFKTANLSRIEEYYSKLAARLPKDANDFMAAEKAFDSFESATSKSGLSYTILNLVAPIFTQIPRAVGKEIATRDALYQACAALDTHADLSKGLPLKDHRIDLDGNEIRVKKKGAEWIIYSIGPNETDEGGLDQPKKSSSSVGRNYDWVIHLPKM